MTKGIVFDLDGTLVDSLSISFDAFNLAMNRYGGRSHSAEEIMSYGDYSAKFNEELGKDNGPAAYASCLEFFESNMGRIPLHQGAGELLEKLKSSGVPVSIFTGRPADSTEVILKHHGLKDRFVTVITADHVGHPKPSPEGLHLALSRMKLSPEAALMVGDSHYDMRAARNAGAHGVACLWDFLASRELLSPHQPAHWAECPMDVWEIWRRFSD